MSLASISAFVNVEEGIQKYIFCPWIQISTTQQQLCRNLFGLKGPAYFILANLSPCAPSWVWTQFLMQISQIMDHSMAALWISAPGPWKHLANYWRKNLKHLHHQIPFQKSISIPILFKWYFFGQIILATWFIFVK